MGSGLRSMANDMGRREKCASSKDHVVQLSFDYKYAKFPTPKHDPGCSPTG